MIIEFFHDTICSFCFPMSYRMRQVQNMHPEIKIIHRGFPLVWEESGFNRMFGSRKNAKKEILSHWARANENDDLHRFNIEGMEKQTFEFPASRNGLIAAKAAGLVGGEEEYWAVFDRLQYALFAENRNIDDLEVLYSCIQDTALNFSEWEDMFHSPYTIEKLNEDFNLATYYDIHSVPCLIINKKYLLSGAQPLNKILSTIQNVRKEEEISIIKGEACNIVDGTVFCE